MKPGDTQRATPGSQSAVRRLLAFYLTGQFGRFLLVGGVALICHWLSRFGFNLFVSYAWAIVLAYLVGIAVAFTLNKIYVFPYSRRSLNFEMFFFFLVNIAAFPVVWAVAYLLGERVLAPLMPREIALALAHGFAITLPVFVNYALHKLVTFRGA
jgi:putative flippase GtrA